MQTVVHERIHSAARVVIQRQLKQEALVRECCGVPRSHLRQHLCHRGHYWCLLLLLLPAVKQHRKHYGNATALARAAVHQNRVALCEPPLDGRYRALEHRQQIGLLRVGQRHVVVFDTRRSDAIAIGSAFEHRQHARNVMPLEQFAVLRRLIVAQQQALDDLGGEWRLALAKVSALAVCRA